MRNSLYFVGVRLPARKRCSYMPQIAWLEATSDRGSRIEDDLFSILNRQSSILDLRFPDSNDSAGEAPSGVARRLGLQVIGVGVNYHAVADDRAVAVQFHHRIIVFEMGHSALIGFDVAHVAGVALGGFRRPVWRGGRVEMAARGRAVLRAAIAELVNVESMLAGGEAFDVRHDFDVSAGLDEGHHAANIITF